MFFCVVHYQKKFNWGKFSDFNQLSTISIPGATAKIPNIHLSLSIVFFFENCLSMFFPSSSFFNVRTGTQKRGAQSLRSGSIHELLHWLTEAIGIARKHSTCTPIVFFFVFLTICLHCLFCKPYNVMSWDFSSLLFPAFLLFLISASSCHSVSQFWWKSRGVFHWRCKFHLWENFLYIYHGISKKRHWTSSLIWMGLWN